MAAVGKSIETVLSEARFATGRRVCDDAQEKVKAVFTKTENPDQAIEQTKITRPGLSTPQNTTMRAGWSAAGQCNVHAQRFLNFALTAHAWADSEQRVIVRLSQVLQKMRPGVGRCHLLVVDPDTGQLHRDRVR